MTQIESKIRINAPKAKVWEALSDFGGIQNFHTGLKSSHSTSATNGGVGATRQCDLKPMGVIQEKIIEWNDGESMLVAITEGKNMPPIDFSSNNTTGGFKLKEIGMQTEVTFSLQYKTKGVAGAAMNPMLKGQFTKTVEAVVKGLKFYVEKGQKPTPKDVKQMPSLLAA